MQEPGWTPKLIQKIEDQTSKMSEEELRDALLEIKERQRLENVVREVLEKERDDNDSKG